MILTGCVVSFYLLLTPSSLLHKLTAHQSSKPVLKDLIMRRFAKCAFGFISHWKKTQSTELTGFKGPRVVIPELFAKKNSFLKVSVSLGGFGLSVAHGKYSVRRRCVQATKNKAETCSLLDAIGRRSCGRWRDWIKIDVWENPRRVRFDSRLV